MSMYITALWYTQNRKVTQKILNCYVFWKSSEDCSDIFLLKQGNGIKNLFGVFSKMAPFSKIFTIEVPKHDEHKEHTCLHNITEFHNCSFCRFLAIHKRVKLNCKLVANSLHGEGEII